MAPVSDVAQPVANTGFTNLYQPNENTIVDIIFVHGLQGHPYRTWACKSGGKEKAAHSTRRPSFFPSTALRRLSPRKQVDEPVAIFWPRAFLPNDCPKARILTWGYDSNVSKFFGGPANQNNIFGHAKNLLYALNRERRECVSATTMNVLHARH